MDKASPAKPVEPRPSASGENDSEEDKDNLGAISQWCNMLSHQVAAKKTVPPRIQGKPIRAMIDTGATHNYLASAEAERFGLVLEKGVRPVKAINLVAQHIADVAKSVLIKVGHFEGKTRLSIVVMDDFKFILGLEFLQDTRTAVFPYVNSLMMLWAKPCIIPTLAGQTGEKNLSVMQFEKGHKRNEPSYLCTLLFKDIE
ncbi:hypothetical protein Sango_1247400 [Sesamum angolense]|uniref:Uncharacterized protein n=1 Tax=Sesamum angolense TaxID=2727404 RepID=A0AAE1WQL9_9LAMI|nr:hypothetical protein Sango_1247400 [Sesamum angolense]